jgi:DNA-binding MurR/RpiR family transcriptional regulator
MRHRDLGGTGLAGAHGTLGERIRAAAEAFTPADRRIADILASTNMLAGLETIGRLAGQVGVSGPTVLRFSTKLGFAGFADFQDAIRRDIHERLLSPLDLYGRAKAGNSGLIANAKEVFCAGLSRTLDRLNDATLTRVADLLVNPSRSIYFVGGRFTHHFAEILWGHIYQMRAKAYILRPGAVSLKDLLVDLGRRDVLVAFDVRRYQSDTIELAELAKTRRTSVVLFTDTLLSPIARVATHVLTCDLDAPSPYDSMVPCLALMEVVIAAVAERSGMIGKRRIAEIEHLRATARRPLAKDS